jgi:hypothetical protein
MTQAFAVGDLVRIADDLGPTMRHFVAGEDAIVVGSYRERFHCGPTDLYTLHLKGRGEVSWYQEAQLTLVKHAASEVLWEWQREADVLRAQHTDHDWIFQHPEIAPGPPAATLQRLADDLDFGSLWGPHGEGVDWYHNARLIHELAEPFLREQDKLGWFQLCVDVKRLVAQAREAGSRTEPERNDNHDDTPQQEDSI